MWVEKGFAAYTTSVPTTCVSAQGGPGQARIWTYDPPFMFKLGRTSKAVDKKWPTTHYTATARKRGKTIRGKLKLSFSMLSYGTNGYQILTCYGSASFNLKRR